MGSQKLTLTPSWFCAVVVFGFLVADVHSGQCPKLARAGVPYTFSQIASYRSVQTFTWKINSDIIRCSLKEQSCSITSASSIHNATVTQLNDGRYRVSVTLNGLNFYSSSNLEWDEEINNFPISHGECELVIYAFDPKPRESVRIVDYGNGKFLQFGLRMKDSTKPNAYFQVLDKNNNVALQRNVSQVSVGNPEKYLGVALYHNMLPPGTYTMRILLSIRDPENPKPVLINYYEFSPFTIDFPRPVCEKYPYPLDGGEGIAVLCKSKGSYYPAVKCSIVEEDKQTNKVTYRDGLTVSERNNSNGKWTHYCHYLRYFTSTNEKRTVRFRAEMVPVLNSKTLKATASVSDDTAAVEFESPKLAQHSVSSFAMNGSSVEVITKWKAFPPPSSFFLRKDIGIAQQIRYTANYISTTYDAGTLVLRMTSLTTSDIGAFTLAVDNVLGSTNFKFTVTN